MARGEVAPVMKNRIGGMVEESWESRWRRGFSAVAIKVKGQRRALETGRRGFSDGGVGSERDESGPVRSAQPRCNNSNN